MVFRPVVGIAEGSVWVQVEGGRMGRAGDQDGCEQIVLGVRVVGEDVRLAGQNAALIDRAAIVRERHGSIVLRSHTDGNGHRVGVECPVGRLVGKAVRGGLRAVVRVVERTV